jgi:hypothetical protein
VNEPFASAGAPALANRWSRFWFAPAPPTLLHRLRLLTGLLLCGWILILAPHRTALFSLDGWFDVDAHFEVGRLDADRSDNNRPDSVSPVPIGWSIFYLAGKDKAAFEALYWASVAVVVFFTLGLATRITGVLTWIVVVSFLDNPASSYDADFLLAILAFYLMIGYCLLGFWTGRLTPLEYLLGPHDAFVLTQWLSGRRERPVPPSSYATNFVVRLLQVHFALIVVTSGLHKLQSGDWWAGAALWYPLHPPFQTTVAKLNDEKAYAAAYLGVLSLAQYFVLAWQIAFPAFAWRRGFCRVLLIGGAIIGWLGAFFMLGLPLFGPIYLIGCLSYVHADEWQRLRSWLHRGDAKPARASAGANRIKVGSK